MYNESTNRKVRILFFSATNLINGRGTEKVISEFIANAPLDKFEIYLMESDSFSAKRLDEKLLRKVNKNVTQIFKFKIIDYKFEFTKKNIFLFIINELLLRPINLYYQRFINQRKLLYKVKNYSIDIVYMGYNEFLPFVRGLHSKIILTTHNLPAKYPLISRIILNLGSNRLYYHGITGIHYFPAFKQFIKKSKKMYNLCLPNGSCTEKFKPKNNTNKSLQILFVGTIEKEKGILDFLNIFYLLKDTDIDFHIVGNGPLDHEIRIMSKKYQNLYYHGVVNQIELERIYSESDIFLYPTKRDNFALVVLDALSSGLYVITSCLLKGTYDDFQKLNYLEYNSFNNYNTIAVKLQKLNKNRENLRKLKCSIHEYTAQKYDWKEISNRLYKYFEYINDNK